MHSSTAKAPSPVLIRTPARLRWLLAAAALLAIVLLLSLAIGAKPIALPVVIDSLLGHGNSADSVVIRESRLPRTLLGLLGGAALGLAGALTQALTRNPLADPGILGVNAGASFAVIIAVALFNVSGPSAYVAWACGGALLTTLLVYLVGAWGSSRLEPMRFILAGVAVGSVLFGLSSGLVLLNPGAYDRIRFWNAGSLDVRDLQLVLQVAPAIIAGGVIALLLGRSLNAIGMGHEFAVTLGTRPLRVQAWAILAITLLTGATTAVAGPIGFVGLMVPQVARWLVGADQRWILALTTLLAPILLLSADIVGRVLVPGELRVSIVTAFIGAPMLIWMARNKAGRS
ncbi:Ferric enterobactin transport system permease protein FepD [Andreprevotia sp. IGB-42]|uniref:Fe(3+)-siderophore ABC transporter permease n=1 Tax=Andreprevotia sp. IGB-42 TaxID=2497473 RepID=UPI00135B133E|nr:Fe(3+)-siderophore ABC transporter permease [Andreprevotia sp. IGB-42]KAF0812628.1 Ferric enterobactin transport system permease protein FepD [Andreprevotia sp. IGB-42]